MGASPERIVSPVVESLKYQEISLGHDPSVNTIDTSNSSSGFEQFLEF